MQSTSSSTERGSTARSATEILASRYRHLFVLPSSPLLIFYAGIVSFFLALVSRGVGGIVTFVPTFVVSILSAIAVSSALTITDKKTIATFRRTSAVVVAGGILWLFCAAIGVVFTWLVPSLSALSNALVFGAFICFGLEFLVYNGVFTKNALLALGLAAIHPASTLMIIRYYELAGHLDALALVFGVAAATIFVGFTWILKRKKTSRGYNTLELFRSFMKTWAAAEPADLEAIISDHSENSKVTTRVLRFHTNSGDTFLILPGVHPGPFHPIGSYDLPGVLSRAFNDSGRVVTLHRPGGHERNLATSEETRRYAEQVFNFAKTIPLSADWAVVRGPLHSRVGKATVSSTAFHEDLILTISFAPLGSDDLNAQVERDLAGPGSKVGFATYVVDAHNSIDKEQESPDLSNPAWNELFTEIKGEKPKAFSLAYSHSKEVGFPSGEDLTENGIALLMFQADGVKHVLVLADANNAVPSLRGEVAKTLESSGYRLLEFCTSDSHNLAARGLTVARGYEALGERTSVSSIAKVTLDLARLADGRLSSSSYGSGELVSDVKLFGSSALEEFATITQSSSRLGRYYVRFAAAAAGSLLLLSLFL